MSEMPPNSSKIERSSLTSLYFCIPARMHVNTWPLNFNIGLHSMIDKALVQAQFDSLAQSEPTTRVRYPRASRRVIA